MSMHPRYYVGPYMACETLEKVVIAQTTGCINKTCIRHNLEVNSKFCPDCGLAIGVVSCQVNEPIVDVYSLGDRFAEALSPITVSNTLHCWIPNIRRHNPRDFYLDNDALQGVVEIADQAVEMSTMQLTPDPSNPHP